MREIVGVQRKQVSRSSNRPKVVAKEQAIESVSRSIEESYAEKVRADPDYPRFVSFEAFSRSRQKSQSVKVPDTEQKSVQNSKSLEESYAEKVRVDPDYPRFVSFEAFSRSRQAKSESGSTNAPTTLFLE